MGGPESAKTAQRPVRLAGGTAPNGLEWRIAEDPEGELVWMQRSGGEPGTPPNPATADAEELCASS